MILRRIHQTIRAYLFAAAPVRKPMLVLVEESFWHAGPGYVIDVKKTKGRRDAKARMAARVAARRP